MQKAYLMMLLIYVVFATGCSKTGTGDTVAEGYTSGVPSASSSTGGGSNGGGQPTPGVITAGEWNDLDHWPFWDSLNLKADYAKYASYWKFYTNYRMAAHVVDAAGNPVGNALVTLKNNGSLVFATRTDNFGKAELWATLFVNNTLNNMMGYSLEVNGGAAATNTVKLYADGTNEMVLPTAYSPSAKMEIAFMVDATGSMGDELSYLQTELKDVISRVHANNQLATILTSAVFYRDKGDQYLTKVSGFTTDAQTTINFIKEQKADGGGDFPEAVHSALEKSVNELQWSADARTRILFLLLDAPPHHEDDVMASLQTSISRAAEKGIKVIPITASGINKETEFLMRYLAQATNGTYVFITNHSGVGGNHIEATVGDYKVEYLNNLMVRLIDKYAH